MPKVIDLSGPCNREQRRRFIDAIFLDPSKDTVEDMQWEVDNGREVISTRYRFIDADRCAVFATDEGYPVYMVAIDPEECAITASTPVLETHRIAFTKAWKRHMRTPAGEALFKGTWSGLEAADVNKTRLGWAKFLGFAPTSVIVRWRRAFKYVGLTGEFEVPYPASALTRIVTRPHMIRLVYGG